ncbi:MAG: TIGR03013 family XrtA/PEP-CTERM system glycosyltransferase [Thiohalomonadales bacterium]
MVRVFKQYIPVSFVILAIVEFMVFATSVYVGVAIRFADSANNFSIEFPESLGNIYPKAIIFAFVMFLSLGAMGLYQRRYRHGISGMVLRLVSAMAAGAIAITLVYYTFPDLFLGRGAMGYTFLSGFIVILLIRLIFLKTVDQELLKRRILVLGAGELACQINQQLRRRTDQRGFHIVGYVHVRGEHDAVDESLILRPDQPLLSMASTMQVDEVVVAVGDRRRKAFPVHELLDCKLSGIDVIDLQGFFERELGKLKLDILNPSWMIFSDGFNQGDINDAYKRGFDILLSLVLLFVTWPFMLVVAAAIWLDDRHAVIYKQVRVGQHWQLFNVYKFRSMRIDAEAQGAPQWAKKEDNRVTAIGKFIRKVRLDELPQIVNVLKGEMSFVGPRPERPEFVTQLSEQIPYYAERHRVKPGITGWAQVCYPYGASEKDSLEKLQYDLYYIKNYTFFLDLVVILQTAHEILWGRGGR